MSADGNGVPSGETISDRTHNEDRSNRRTRLYIFPGGMLEVQERPGDEPGTGAYLEYRQSYSDARAFGSGEAERLGLVNDEKEPA